MKIIYVKHAKSKGYLIIGVADGESRKSYFVSEAEYSSMGSPMSGDAAGRELAEALRLSDLKYKAEIYALRMLSYGDNSRKNLCRKLVMKGIPKDMAEDTVEYVAGLGYIKEDEQLEKIILNEANFKLRGQNRIKAFLISKGYSGSDAEKKISELCASGEIDFSLNAKRLIEKKLPREHGEEEEKILLYKNGYRIC